VIVGRTSCAKSAAEMAAGIWPGSTPRSVAAMWDAGVDLTSDIIGMAMEHLYGPLTRDEDRFRWVGDAVLVARPYTDKPGAPFGRRHRFHMMVVHVRVASPGNQRTLFHLLGGRAALPPYLWVAEEEEPVYRRTGKDPKEIDILAPLIRIMSQAGALGRIKIEEPPPPGSRAELGGFLVLYRAQAGRALAQLRKMEEQHLGSIDLESRKRAVDLRIGICSTQALLDTLQVLIDFAELTP
jgi:hypothetical protein